MKPALKILTSILLLFVTLQLFAQDEIKKEKKRYERFKEKNISKTYPASGNTLTIESRFGDVVVSTWDKNEIKVDIHIEASSTDKEVAEKTFERLGVKDKQEGKDINFTTTIENFNIRCDNCKNTMRVDYDIHMPSSNALNIKNSFGDITVPDYNGNISLTSSYGSLTAGKLSHLEKLDVGFGKVNLKNLNNTDITFRYTTITIDNLSGNTKMKMQFCPYSKITLANDLSSLTVDANYSTIHLQPPVNFSASYDVSTRYGSLIDKTDADIKRTDAPEQYGPDLNKHYEGKSGSGSAKITIRSSFGSVMIGEGTKDDMKEKKKVKS